MVWLFAIRATPWLLLAAMIAAYSISRFRSRAATRLFGVVAAVSLLPLIATVVFWMRSYWKHDLIVFRHEGAPWALSSVDRELKAGPVKNTPRPGRFILPEWQSAYLSLAWVFALPPFVWSVIWAVRREMRMRGDARYCTKCDYNLTGNVSEICPECGAPVQLEPKQ